MNMIQWTLIIPSIGLLRAEMYYRPDKQKIIANVTALVAENLKHEFIPRSVSQFVSYYVNLTRGG